MLPAQKYWVKNDLKKSSIVFLKTYEKNHKENKKSYTHKINWKPCKVLVEKLQKFSKD